MMVGPAIGRSPKPHGKCDHYRVITLAVQNFAGKMSWELLMPQQAYFVNWVELLVQAGFFPSCLALFRRGSAFQEV